MPARKKILMLTTQLGYGGAETSFIRLANLLAQSMDVAVALFTSDYGAGAYSTAHEPLHAEVLLLDAPQPCGQLRRWWHRIKTLRTLKPQYDATISFLSGPNLVNVLAGSNARSIVSMRGSRAYDPVSPKLQRWVFQWLLDPIVYSLAARIVPISPGLTHEIRQVAGAKAVAKSVVIPPFVELPVLQQRRAAPPPEPYAQLNGQKVIVSVGRLSVEKGFQHLIRIVAELRKTQQGVKLLLVGDGPMLGLLRAQCQKLGLATDDFTPGIPSVIFAGHQQNPLPLMALGRVVAITSATEGFGNVTLEAIAAGVPIVAADTPWGARFILAPDTALNSEPYPTTHATATEYGVLMPRIDQVEYATEWVRVLGEYAQAAAPSYPKASLRLGDFELAVVGHQWKQLIEGLHA